MRSRDSLRIAFVSHAYPRWEGDLAGAFLARLAEALVQRGHAVTAVVPSDAGRGGAIQLGGVTVERARYAPAPFERLAHRGALLREVLTPWGAFAFLSQLAALQRQLRRESFDVVHAHWWVPGGVAAWRASRKGAPSPVVTLHGTDVALLDRMPGARSLARAVFRSAHRITAVSSTLANRVRPLLDARHPAIPVIPMPAAVDRFPNAPPARGQGIVTVSRLTPQKRIDALLRAAAELAARGRPMPLTIVGGGPEERTLCLLAKSLRLRQVSFVGPVAPVEVPTYLQQAAVAVFPARAEGFGLAAAEALMCGVPVVACGDGGGLLDVVPSTGPGRHAPATEPAAIADQIESLSDSADAHRLAWQEGQRWRARLDPDAVAARFEELYRVA